LGLLRKGLSLLTLSPVIRAHGFFGCQMIRLSLTDMGLIPEG